MRLTIRGYGDGELRFRESVTVGDDDDFLRGLAETHAKRLLEYSTHMIEIEFLDELDPLQRFFRIGDDPAGMVMPIKVRTP